RMRLGICELLLSGLCLLSLLRLPQLCLLSLLRLPELRLLSALLWVPALALVAPALSAAVREVLRSCRPHTASIGRRLRRSRAGAIGAGRGAFALDAARGGPSRTRQLALSRGGTLRGVRAPASRTRPGIAPWAVVAARGVLGRDPARGAARRR